MPWSEEFCHRGRKNESSEFQLNTTIEGGFPIRLKIALALSGDLPDLIGTDSPESDGLHVLVVSGRVSRLPLLHVTLHVILITCVPSSCSAALSSTFRRRRDVSLRLPR